jgi:Ca2+-binding EF-hand superfamily protein
MMSTGTIGSLSSLGQIQDCFEKLRSGQVTLSKEDLTNLEADVSSAFDELLSNYDTIDINGDGISSAELQTYNRSKGINGSGKSAPPSLSKDELTAMRDKIAEEEGEAPEALNSVIKNFDAADTDQDGKVSAEEFRVYAEVKGLQMPEPPSGNMAPPPPPSAASSAQDEEDATTSTSSTTKSSSTQQLLAMLLDKYASGLTGYSNSQALQLLENIEA